MAAEAPALEAIYGRLQDALEGLAFGPPVSHVYNPLSYASEPFRRYLQRYVAGPAGRLLLLGMNPGPWGMAQTGVPFGEVSAVRDWLGITGEVTSPQPSHPQRPIQGFACPRREVSGQRLWGLFASMYSSAEEFSRQVVVLNYCPLVFMEESGRNRTPDRLPRAEREPLFAACDAALAELVAQLQPSRLIGVGRFAWQRLDQVGRQQQWGLPCQTILHPSPASPQANADWASQVRPVLESKLTP